VPVSGLWLDGRLLFSTSPESVKGKNLLRDPRVAVHLESGEEVVIMEGEVERVSIDESAADVYMA
jgi:pyridoxine/pyridoxamine 5'-phosphate oxidase